MDCIFCKIIAGEIPAKKIYEDENVLSFLDISPVNFGHALVIPKKHYTDLLSADEATLSFLMLAVKKIAPILIRKVGASGFNLNLNNGSVAGQVVDHLHFHIIPRFTNDGLKLWLGGDYDHKRSEKLIEEIKESLS